MKHRKPPTEEQKAKAAERRAKFRALVKQVAGMDDVTRARMTNQLGAVPSCAGKTYSLHNTLLLMLQIPGVSMVGGFKQWRTVGRCVRKGEHGAMVWFPLGKSKDSPEIMSEAIDASAEDLKFMMGTVFDISQTEEIKPEPKPEAVAA